ncbi:MAG: NAD(P)H-dependent oxidoreductase [Tepidisphaeraceae bacterium]
MIHGSDEQLLEHLRWRYACKRFDPQAKIPPMQWRTIEAALQLAPSSYDVQPWHFVVITDAKLKEDLTPISRRQVQLRDSSHVVVVTARRDYTDHDLNHLIDRIAAVHGQALASLEKHKQVIRNDTVLEPDREALRRYLERQTYIALGFGLFAAAMLGIDACPMEGIDTDAYDRRLNLMEQGYRTLGIACFGYRLPNDPHAQKPKVRYDQTDIFTHIPPTN